VAKFERLTPPSQGQAITMVDGKLNVPDQPIIPFIEGDGTGPDIWKASQPVFDAASGYDSHRRGSASSSTLSICWRPMRPRCRRWLSGGKATRIA
jgi:hypothetical protein